MPEASSIPASEPSRNPAVTYQHTQWGHWTLVVLFVLAALIAVIARSVAIFGVQCLIMAIAFSFVGGLTTTIDDGVVQVRFGPIGVIRGRFALAEITAARVVRNSPVSGWGIRYIPHGQLWNVWGLDAVELQLKDGTRFRIGTDEPRELLLALRQAGVNA